MMLATRTVTINAAFLQEIKDDNIELSRLMNLLHDRFCQSNQRLTDTASLAELLNRLRDQMAMHFALEEAFGYFEDAIDVAPRLSERAEALRCQHEDFYEELCQLVEHAEKLHYGEVSIRALGRLARRFAVFYDAFDEHEARERALIMEAFDDDVGVGD